MADLPPDIRLSALYVYPIKSARGMTLKASEVDGRGLVCDRRWMLVDEAGRFLSQRRFSRMALIGVRLDPDRLLVDAPGMPGLQVPLEPPDGKPLHARIWNDSVEVLRVSDGADRWFEEFLGVRCKLVYLPDESVRQVDQDYGRSGDQVGLADGFPFLLVSEASLAELNTRLEHPVPMNRFRPNLVIWGAEPFAEDGWSVVRIGSITFRVAKPCARCAITTIDQGTAVKDREPLRTLARFRRDQNKVLFGQNVIHEDIGTLRVGDPVEILTASVA